MEYAIIDFFIDPVLRAPTIASMLMCMTSSIVGVCVLLRKRSLLGETLSHASYPGVVLGVIVGSFFFPPHASTFSYAVLFCSALSSLAGVFLVDLLEKRFRVNDDAALCFVLSLFLGIGVLIASRIQTTHAMWYRQVQSFLYGQTATMLDEHIYIYAALLVITAVCVLIQFKEIKIFLFDRSFAKSVGVNLKSVEISLLLLTVLATVVGIRSTGVVMMAGMLVAPALAASFITQNFRSLFWIAPLVGAASGFSGNYLSMYLPTFFSMPFQSLPTGPMILLSASFFCFIALILSPRNGLVFRMLRAQRFRRNCQMDNFLKALWKEGENAEAKKGAVLLGLPHSSRLITMLKRKGFVVCIDGNVCLTEAGKAKAARIVRLHRLWELYLVHLGCSVEKVHASAEEMEHVLTPEIEAHLTRLLDDPLYDPHDKPIPKQGRII